MKKILVVLLILAVAGGVFAQQGQWSLGGNVEIGTRIDLDPDPEVDGADDPAIVDGIAWHNWDAIRGTLGVGYTRGDVYVGLGINTISETRLTTTYSGDTFRGKFQFDNLLGILSGGRGVYGGEGFHDVKRLWGEMKFFDGSITVLAAYRNDETEYWISDKTGTFLSDSGKGSYYGNHWTGPSNWLASNPMSDGNTFTYNDSWMGNDLLLIDAAFGGLSFGVMIPNIFPFASYWSGNGPLASSSASYQDAQLEPIPATPWLSQPKRGTGLTQFVDDTIKQSILGVRFEQSPFEFAAQFQLENYGVYFGGRFTTGAITVGLSFTGILDGDGQGTAQNAADADPTQIKIGGRVEYGGSGFGGGLKAFYESKDLGMDNGLSKAANGDYYLSTIGVEPYFFYDAIPSHLRFALDIGFYFFNDTNGTDSTKATVWAFEPQIFWNFLGTGAGSYWSYDTGIMARYRMANVDTRDLPNFGATSNNSVTFLDLVFKWGF